MNLAEMQCPSCNGFLHPSRDREGLLECRACRTLFAPEAPRSTADMFTAVFAAIVKVFMIIAGLTVVAAALLFAGCLFAMRGF